MAPASSRTMPRSCGSPPSDATSAARPRALEATIWSGPGRAPGRDQLVAGGDDGDARPAADGHGGMAHRGGERQLAHAERASRRRGGRRPRGSRGRRGGRGGPATAGLADADRAVGERLGILLDQDRVGALGDRRAGEDADGLAGPILCRRSDRPAGGRADDREACAERSAVGGADGVAVHGRGGEGRLGAPRRESVGEHAAGGLGERARSRPASGATPATMRAIASSTGRRLIASPAPARRPTGRRASRRGGCR